jgi:hypothetical protein
VRISTQSSVAGCGRFRAGRTPKTAFQTPSQTKRRGSREISSFRVLEQLCLHNAIWLEVLATPTWHPATGIPTRKLLIKRGDTWEPKTEIIGPGYRAAYGLVALVHHQIEGVNERGEPAPKADAFRALFSAKNSRPIDRAAGGIAGKNGKIAGL